MKSIPLITLIAIIMLGTSAATQAQTVATEDTVVAVKSRIVMLNGKEFIGHIISDDGREVLIETENIGRIYLVKSNIRSMSVVDESKAVIKGTYREAGPFITRYFFTNNALPLKKGENYVLARPLGGEVHFSPINNLSIGVIAS